LPGTPAISISFLRVACGYFLAATGRGITKSTQWIILLYVGIASLTLGVVSLGIGLLAS
jgi:hypothetical protein